MWRELGGLSALAVLAEWVRRRRFARLVEQSDELFFSGVRRLLPTAKRSEVQRERAWIAALSGLPRMKVASELRLCDLDDRADAGLALQPGDLLEDVDRRLGTPLQRRPDMTMAEIVVVLLSTPNAKPP